MINKFIAACIITVVSFSAFATDYGIYVSEHPTTREDKSPLAYEEISHYKIRLYKGESVVGEASTLLPEGMAVFKDLTPGDVYSADAITVDTFMQESEPSGRFIFTVVEENNNPSPVTINGINITISNCPTNKICKVIIEDAQ